MNAHAAFTHAGIIPPDLINIMTELSITVKCDDLFPGMPCWKWLHNNRWTLISERG